MTLNARAVGAGAFQPLLLLPPRLLGSHQGRFQGGQFRGGKGSRRRGDRLGRGRQLDRWSNRGKPHRLPSRRGLPRRNALDRRGGFGGGNGRRERDRLYQPPLPLGAPPPQRPGGATPPADRPCNIAPPAAQRTAPFWRMPPTRSALPPWQRPAGRVPPPMRSGPPAGRPVRRVPHGTRTGNHNRVGCYGACDLS